MTCIMSCDMYALSNYVIQPAWVKVEKKFYSVIERCMQLSTSSIQRR